MWAVWKQAKRSEGQVLAILLPVGVGRSAAEKSRAMIPGEHKQQQAGLEAFSEDQGLVKKDKVTLATFWRRRGGWMEGRRQEKVEAA